MIVLPKKNLPPLSHRLRLHQSLLQLRKLHLRLNQLLLRPKALNRVTAPLAVSSTHCLATVSVLAKKKRLPLRLRRSPFLRHNLHQHRRCSRNLLQRRSLPQRQCLLPIRRLLSRLAAPSSAARRQNLQFCRKPPSWDVSSVRMIRFAANRAMSFSKSQICHLIGMVMQRLAVSGLRCPMRLPIAGPS